MEREEEIKLASEAHVSQMCINCSAKFYCGENNKRCGDYPNQTKVFADGAKWADEHPKNIWHKASEEPQGTYSVLCDGSDDMQWVVGYLYVDMAYANWKDYAESINVIRWAYISDILPKGGEK